MSGIDRKSLIILAEDAANKLSTVLVDSSRRLVSVFVGSEGATVKQNATGELVTEIQGSEALAVKQKATTGELISEMQGSEGVVVKQETTGELVSVMQGSENKIILQDNSGAMISIMKGIVKGELQTIALDSENAIKAVVYGDYDYEGNITATGFSEHLARTFGITSIDNKGHLIWYDTFEDTPLHWAENTDNAAHSIVLDGTYTWHGNKALKFILGTVASGVASEIDVIDYALTGNYGLEVRFNHHPRLDIYLYLSLKGTTSGLKYVSSSGKWYYYNSSSTWTEFTTQLLPRIDVDTSLPLLFNSIKFVVDYSAETYSHVLLNGNKINLPNIKYDTSAGLGYASFIKIKVINTHTTAHDIWIDNVILTKERDILVVTSQGIGFNNNKFNTAKFNSR